jgi:hypothetical protein
MRTRPDPPEVAGVLGLAPVPPFAGDATVGIAASRLMLSG